MTHKTIIIVKPKKSRLLDGGYDLRCTALDSIRSDSAILTDLKPHQVFQLDDRFFAQIANPHVPGYWPLKENEIAVVEFKTKLLCQLLLGDTWKP